MKGVLTNDHFLLGLGLAAGPAVILCFALYAYFKWGRSWLLGDAACGSVIANCMEHSGFTKTLAFVVEECKAIWLEIKEINKRQIDLRQKLPADYVSKSDLLEIRQRLQSIDSKLDKYMEITLTGR